MSQVWAKQLLVKLLGLSRALSQTRASITIVTLWKVDDLMTSRFVASKSYVAPVTYRPMIIIQIERSIVSYGVSLHYYLKYPSYWVLINIEIIALCIVQVCYMSSSSQPQKARI